MMDMRFGFGLKIKIMYITFNYNDEEIFEKLK